ncbi:MAG: nicotinic acid mononucleotide adenylyltransferase [Bacteroidales bacterium]|nr:nicotinic acid mononucleotide adenylyltransferase [Bacteroidales bacterium]
MKTKGLYFGTFNPLHMGHVTVARHLLKNRFFDSLAFVVSPESPFKLGSEQSAYARLVALRADVASLGLPVEVSDVEFHLPVPNYTINTLRFLDAVEYDTEHILVMGGDNVEKIEFWREFESIINNYRILVYPRPGYEDMEEKCRKYGMEYLADAPLVDISSTEIRNGIYSRGI